jgi:SpoVK/Ycf46/Vps4 family AAA+-type ATPase
MATNEPEVVKALKETLKKAQTALYKQREIIVDLTRAPYHHGTVTGFRDGVQILNTEADADQIFREGRKVYFHENKSDRGTIARHLKSERKVKINWASGQTDVVNESDLTCPETHKPLVDEAVKPAKTVILFLSNGEMIESEMPTTIELKVGDMVRVNRGGAIIGKVDHPIASTNPAQVIQSLDDGRIEVSLNGTNLVVDPGTVKGIENEDRVLLDMANRVVMDNLGKNGSEFTVNFSTGVSWDDIGGMTDAKQLLREAVEFPHIHSDLFKTYAKKPAHGVLLYGPPGCISGDTPIGYVIRTRDGKKQNSKGGLMEHLYRRFHHMPIPGKGSYQRPQTVNSKFFVQSMNDEGRIVLSRIDDVVDSGIKEVFRLETASGCSLKLTADHEIWAGTCYKQLRDLAVGDLIYMNPKTPDASGRNTPPYRKEVFVKYHPTARKKIVNGSTYYRLRVYVAAFEASKNNLSYEEYITALNTWTKKKIDRLWTIPAQLEVHHLDENIENNSPENLELVTSSTHKQLHLTSSKRNIAIFVQPDPIVSITLIGEEHVYDIRCADPYRNFLAGNVVVHNCGKTMLGKAAATAIQNIYKGKPSPYAFMLVKGPEILDKYVGNSELKIRNLFARARKHHQTYGYPSVILIDEADAVLRKRDSGISSDILATIVPMFLNEMDGLDQSGAMVLLSTNRADELDSAVVREGRVDMKIKVPRPTMPDAQHIFTLHLSKTPLREGTTAQMAKRAAEELFSDKYALFDISLRNRQALRMFLRDGCSGAMIASIVNASTDRAIRDDIAAKRKKDFGLTELQICGAIKDLHRQYIDLDNRELVSEILLAHNASPRDVVTLSRAKEAEVAA